MIDEKEFQKVFTEAAMGIANTSTITSLSLINALLKKTLEITVPVDKDSARKMNLEEVITFVTMGIDTYLDELKKVESK